jgi:hypothetical protein
LLFYPNLPSEKDDSDKISFHSSSVAFGDDSVIPGGRERGWREPVKLPDGIGIVQPLALAVATGGGGNQATYTRQAGTYQGGGGGDYGIT